MANPVGWFEIYVEDMDRARTFYESVLGITLQQLPTPEGDVSFMMAFPMDPEGSGASGALVKMGDGRPQGNGVLIYFTCVDCSVEAERVASSGGLIFKEKFPVGDYGFIALATDTEGNMFGLHSMS